MPSITLHINIEQTTYSDQTEWRMLGAKGKTERIIDIHKDRTPPKRVLEVGSGDGSILKFLSEKNFGNELYGLEISQSGVDITLAQNIPKLVSCQTFNGYNIPFEDNFFDIVVLSHVLEHVEYERALLREIKRVSKCQVIEIPMDCNGIADPLQKFLGPSFGHINAHSPDSLKFLLFTEGFNVQNERLGLYSTELLAYDYFVNNRNPKNDKTTAAFTERCIKQEKHFESLDKLQQQRAASFYTVICQAYTPSQLINDATETTKAFIFLGQNQAARLVFDHYVPNEHIIRSACDVARAVMHTYPSLAEEYINKALHFAPDNNEALALAKEVKKLLQTPPANSTFSQDTQPTQHIEHPPFTTRIKRAIKEKFPKAVAIYHILKN